MVIKVQEMHLFGSSDRNICGVEISTSSTSTHRPDFQSYGK